MPGTQLWLPQHTGKGAQKAPRTASGSFASHLPPFFSLIAPSHWPFLWSLDAPSQHMPWSAFCHVPSSPEFGHSRHSFQAMHLTLRSSSLGLSSLGNFLLLCRMSLFISYLHQLDAQQVEAGTLLILFSATCASFSLLGLSRAFRQRCPTQEGGWVLGKSLQLDSVKTMLLLGDMDVSYSMWPS